MIDSYRILPRRLLVLLGCVVLLPAGCGKKNIANPNAGTDVTGKVLCRDKPIPYGCVQFISNESGIPVGQGPIQRDGTYKVANVPEGEVRIVVMTSSEHNNPFSGMPGGHGPRLPPGAPPPPGGGPMPGGAEMQGPPTLPPVMLGPRPPMPPEGTAMLDKIQQKYGIPQKSNLTYTVVKGEQTHDIILNID